MVCLVEITVTQDEWAILNGTYVYSDDPAVIEMSQDDMYIEIVGRAYSAAGLSWVADSSIENIDGADLVIFTRKELREGGWKSDGEYVVGVVIV